MTQKIDGHEAYRDDPEYTAPEMQPGHGEDIGPELHPERAVAAATGLTIGSAAGAFAGEILIEEIEEEQADLTPRRDE